VAAPPNLSRPAARRFFFSQDCSSHWYLVPEEHRAEWERWSNLDENDVEAWEAPPWAERINGWPGNYTFENPKERSC